MKRLDYHGDTIIEVLVAIVVVSSVLAGAYITSNHSLQNSRQAQERSEALKYVEAQIEQIKAKTSIAASQTTPFCFANDGTTPPSTDIKCKFGNIPGGYKLSIDPPVAGKYVIAAVWDNAQGNGQDQISMIYKIN